MSLGAKLWAVSPLLYAAYAKVRGAMVDRAIGNDAARIAGRLPVDPAPLIDRLRRRLSSRGVTPRLPSQPHILYISRPSLWERHNIPSEIAKVGRVDTYFYQDRGFYEERGDWKDRRGAMAKDLISFVHELHSRDPIDLVVSYLSGSQVTRSTVDEISAIGAVTCNYCLDDKLGFYGRRNGRRWSGPAEIAAGFDLNLTSSIESIAKYESVGALAMFWPEGANPEHYRPLPMEFQRDVSFVGACYGYRPMLLEHIKKAGVEVAGFGPGWPSGVVTDEQMVEIYASSRINLGFGGIGYSVRSQCLKGRDFEVPMSGALYLTSANQELDLVWKVDDEIFTYVSAADCVRKIKFLLANPGVCEQVRKNARTRGLREHTWAERFRAILAVLDRASESV